MMNISLNNRPNRVCCRLCLAPENECVNIYMTSAADKEPLSLKINACVRIKVQKDDRLSPKICHACISYLNSWQSFKNRCDAAQKKQRMWMGLMPANESMSGNKPQANILQQRLLQQQQQQHKQNQLASLLSQNRNITLQPIAPKTNLLQQQLQKKSTPPEPRPILLQQQRQKDGSEPDFIKQEPNEHDDAEDDPDIDDEKMDDDVIDPTQFLAREDEDYSRDGDEPLSLDATEQNAAGENPQILASLGLHSVNSGYGGMSDSESQNGDTSSQQSGNKCIQIPANCTICDMRFSNRANARRHERNIHGVILNPIGNNSGSGINGSIGALSASTPKSLANTPKLISLIKKPKMPVLESAENWDYSNPQKYRSYLTPAKLSFILQNLEFLEQSQDMLCKCCDKQFPSYKFFMGHMRKRYHNLPRNVCFKCLKHFESKGQFIGHLKRKTCLNLYKIVMNDDTITKDLTPDNATKGAKEFLSDKTYACKLCPKQYPYKSELRNHVFELKEHPEYLKNKENDTLECAYCDKSFEDQTERKRHYNNLDCISFIVCGTCKDQVPSNQAFVEHVYSIHLKKNTINGADSLFEQVPAGEDDEAENLLDCPDEPISLSKQPQACPVCDKQYNNYYNVLRHMESKHPDQVPRIYECVKCFETFVRQSELKEHVARVHNLALISGKMIPLSNNVRSFICRECGETFNEMMTWLDHQVTHGKFNCNQCEYSCETRDDLEDHLNSAHSDEMTPPKLKLKLYSCKHCTNTYSNVDGLRDHMFNEHNIQKEDLMDLTQDDDGKSDDLTNFMLNAQQFSRMQAKPTLRCRYCNDKFASKPDLTQHMINEHGTSGQLLSCTLCQAEFVNDKGLKVHLWRSHQLREPDWGGVLPEISRLQTQPIKNKVVTPAKEYECDICHIVYKSRDQLRLHCTSVHGFDSSFMSQDATMDDDDCIMTENVDLPNVWYQCRYCDQSFNSSNQLISHMDGHDEDQPQDYTCRECSSAFGARKELWAHRHKNHPRSADPSACDMCKRVFFDKTEIYYHNMHAHTQADFLANRSGGGSSNQVIRESLSQKQKFFGGNNNTNSNNSGINMSTNNRNSSSHHGIGNRASSADGNNSFDPMAQFYDASEQQEYSCDMCPKTFNVLNALQVHRGWHLRGPDGRKVRDPADTWQPDQLPPSKVRKMTNSGRSLPSSEPSSATPTTNAAPRVPVCPFCKAKFASGNNLRRHIVEVHKRNDARYQREASGSPSIVVDKPKECSSCNLTFKTIAEWVDHKIQHARTIKPSTTFEWNCEICGKMFTRKERLLQHMITHLNNDFGNNDSNMGGNTNENTEDGDNSSQFENHSSDGSRDGADDNQHHQNATSTHEDDDSQSEAQQQNDNLEQNGFGCELCQVFFKTAKELRKHVTEHFVNGGNTNTNQTQTQSSSQNQSSAASSSDESGSTHESSRSNPQMTAQEHQAFAAISQEYKCRICGSVCQDQLEMMTCMGSHQIPTALKCSECQLYFANSKQVLDHETLYHPKGYI